MRTKRPRHFPLFCTLLLLCSTMFCNLHAQKRANNWSFADYELDFNNTPVTVKREFASHLNRGMGIISDDDGKLLFYTDGYTVWNRNHNSMPNGIDLIPSHQSTSTQQSVVIPKPGSSNIFYIFTVDPWNGQSTAGLYYSEVDISLASGLGDVTVKGVKLVNNTTNNLSATFHSNQKDVWLITHENNSNKYFVLLITEAGISAEISQQEIGVSHSFWGGQLKFSPDGRKIAVSYSDFTGGMSLFDFNNATGTLSNPMSFTFEDLDSSPIIEGLEFSSDATKLYTYELRYDRIIQFDVSRSGYEAIKNSRYIIYGRVIYNGLRQFQLAPDGKIYITKGGGGGGTGHLGVIVNPNAEGDEVIVEENGLYLNGGDSFVNYTPIFIQNYFFKTSFRYDSRCQGAPVKFSITNEYLIDSVKWQFGDEKGSVSGSRTPEIHYDTPGTYDVTLLAYYSGQADTITRQITIDPYTSFDLGENFSTCRGTRLTADSGYDNYAWNTGDTVKSTVLNTTQWYKLVARNNFGCSYRDSVFVTVKELPVIDLPETVQFNNLPSVQLDAGAFSSYLWSTGESTRTVTIVEPGWYSVAVQNADGCKAAKSVFVGNTQTVPQTEDWVWLNPLPSGDAGKDIYFVDDHTGFIISESKILRTTDGGATWELQMKVASAKRMDFKDQIGYIVGNNGSVYKSTHNGGGWNKINFGYTDHLNAVTIIHPDTVIITSDNRLFITHDGGKNWVDRSIPDVDVEDSFFTSSETGHAACRNGTIVKTTDGGLTWQAVRKSNTFPSDFFRITFVNPDVGYATSEHHNIFKTINGGETWAEITTPYDAIYGMYFVNEDVGYMAGEHGVIHKTVNGGSSWTWAGFLNGRYDASDMNALYFFDEDRGFAVGFRGRILKTYNGGKTWQPYGMTYNDINDIIFPSSATGYALADRIYKTTDHGNTWAPLKNNLVDGTWYYQSGVFFTEEKGYVVASNYYSTKVMLTTDGGQTWSNAPVPGIVLSFIDDTKGFAGGSGIYKTVNGGLDWEYVASFSASDIHFINEQKGFALRYGDLYKTVDGGKNWELTYEVYGYLTEIDFVNENVGYISAEYGIVLKTTDGGETWEEKETTYDHLLAIDFISENIGFTSGEYGRNFSTADGGNTWTAYSIPAQIRTVNLTDDGKVYVGGRFGTLLSRLFTYPDVTIKALKADSITANSALLRAVVATNASLVENVHIEYGTNSTFSNTIALTPGSVSAGKNREYKLPVLDLLADTVYSFRLTATVNGIDQTSNAITFRTLPEFELSAPLFGNITATRATVWSNVISNMKEITNLQFEYDTVSSFTSTTVINGDPAVISPGAPGYVEASLQGLLPETKYFIRLKGTHNGKIVASAVQTFQTRPEYEISFYSPWILGNEVTLHASVISYDKPLTNLQLEYGLSQTYGTTVATTPSEVNGLSWNQVSAKITISYTDSVYYYRIKGLYNGKPFISDYKVFRASGGVILFAGPAKNIGPNSATLTGHAYLQGEYINSLVFEYGITDSFEQTGIASGFIPNSDNFSITTDLQELTEDTEYLYRVKSTLWNGKIYYSDTMKFRTSIVTGISDHMEKADVTLYPNPALDEITLTSSQVIEEVFVVNTMGKVIANVRGGNFSCALRVSEFSHGIYYVQIRQGGKTSILKFVKN